MAAPPAASSTRSPAHCTTTAKDTDVPGNSKRKGAIKKTGKGNPTAGSGGRVRRGLEGKGPTPEGHRPALPQGPQAAKNAREKATSARSASRRGARAAATTSGSPVATRCVEALRAELPVTAVYVAEGAERDGRLREVFSIAADKGLSLLEVPRVELDRMTSGAVHQGLAARVPAYEYADPDDLLDPAAANHEQPLIVALDSVTDPRNLGAVVRSAAGFGAHGVRRPRASRRRHDRQRLEDLGRCGRPRARRAGRQPDPAAQGLPGGGLHGRRPGRRRRRLAARPRPRRRARS